MDDIRVVEDPTLLIFRSKFIHKDLRDLLMCSLHNESVPYRIREK